MGKATLRSVELLLLGIAFFFLVPAYSSTPQPYGLWPGLAFAGAAFLASQVLALRRGADNLTTGAVKLAGFLVFGSVVYLRCASA